jgi:hypothetical protein
LNSIGTEQARTAVKNRVVEGTVRFHMQHQGGSIDGKEVFLSDGNRLISLLKLPQSQLSRGAVCQRRQAHDRGYHETRGLFRTWPVRECT